MYWFQEGIKEHCALVFWDITHIKSVLCRVHSSCITGDIFHSLKCDCGEQLHASLKMISQQWGICIYLNQEGRDIGLINKIHAYSLQDLWFDTVEANQKLNLPVDNRNYDIVKVILDHIWVNSVQLITNNPDKVEQVTKLGISVTKTVPIIVWTKPENEEYLTVKREKMRHIL